MGPRSGERGNDGKHEEKSMRTLRLQWGRAQVSAEIPFLGRYLGLDRLASMGPRSGERGNQGRASADCEGYSASMGPRSGERGNPATALQGPIALSGFNGAALR